MSRGEVAGRRAVFVPSLTAAVVLVAAVGAGGGWASTSKALASSPKYRPHLICEGTGHARVRRVLRDHVGRVVRPTGRLALRKSSRPLCPLVAQCASDSAGKDGVTVTANWCWAIANNTLESYSFKIHQNSDLGWAGFEYISNGSPVIDTRSGGISQTTASETFHVEWTCIQKDCQPLGLRVHYWAHVVGGATNLDFAEIGVDAES